MIMIELLRRQSEGFTDSENLIKSYKIVPGSFRLSLFVKFVGR